MSVPVCGATTNKGRRCKLQALPSGMCSVHDPALRCGASRKKGKVCQIATGGGPCDFHSDRHSTAKYSVVQKRVERDDGMEHTCVRCQRTKAHSHFWNSKRRKYGATCKTCLSQKELAKDIKKGSSFIHYPTYIASSFWAAKRREYWKSGLYKECFMCSKPKAPGMQLHHLTYERLGRESLEDLVPMCVEHHDLVTRGWRSVKELGTGMNLQEVTLGIVDAYRKKHGLPLRVSVIPENELAGANS